MDIEEKGDGLVGSSSNSNKRQRFYIELKPGETTIVSWKKLLREASEKDQCFHTTNANTSTLMGSNPSGALSSSSAHEIPKRALNFSKRGATSGESLMIKRDYTEVGQYTDSSVRSERLNNNATSSGRQQPKKRRINLTKVKSEKHDDLSCTKHVRPGNMSKKATSKTTTMWDKPSSHANSSVVVKDNHLDGPPAFVEDAPVLMNMKKSSSFGSKSKCPSPMDVVRDASVFPLKAKHRVQQKPEKMLSERRRMKVGIVGDSSDVMHRHSAGKSIPLQINPASRKLMGKEKIEVSRQNRLNGKNGGNRELLDAISPGCKSSLQHLRGAAIAVNDATPFIPFNIVLERAIKELEETIADSKPFKLEASDAHTSWSTIDKELPFEVKLKLGKVARIVQSSQETVPQQLVNHLVSILGKLVHGKTSKRILRKMVMLKLSARKAKAEKFKEIKSKILAMASHRQVGAAPSAEEILAEAYKLDSATEDNLSDLYDLCVQGFAGDKDVQVQKLFVELAELWPEEVMDHHKLRDAIDRGKSRRVLADKNQGHKAVHCDSLVGPRVEDSVNRKADPVPCLKRKVTNPSNLVLSSPAKEAVTKARAEQLRQPDKSSYRHAKGLKQELPTERNALGAATHTHVKEQQKQQVPEKKNVKIDSLYSRSWGPTSPRNNLPRTNRTIREPLFL